MGVMTYTRSAKCKDCKYCEAFKIGNRKRHKCTNQLSAGHGIEKGEKTVSLNDFACEQWKIG
jgi:hypothetical protein